jgi:hypothetical protein
VIEGGWCSRVMVSISRIPKIPLWASIFDFFSLWRFWVKAHTIWAPTQTLYPSAWHAHFVDTGWT